MSNLSCSPADPGTPRGFCQPKIIKMPSTYANDDLGNPLSHDWTEVEDGVLSDNQSLSVPRTPLLANP